MSADFHINGSVPDLRVELKTAHTGSALMGANSGRNQLGMQSGPADLLGLMRESFLPYTRWLYEEMRLLTLAH